MFVSVGMALRHVIRGSLPCMYVKFLSDGCAMISSRIHRGWLDASAWIMRHMTCCVVYSVCAFSGPPCEVEEGKDRVPLNGACGLPWQVSMSIHLFLLPAHQRVLLQWWNMGFPDDWVWSLIMFTLGLDPYPRDVPMCHMMNSSAPQGCPENPQTKSNA